MCMQEWEWDSRFIKYHRPSRNVLAWPLSIIGLQHSKWIEFNERHLQDTLYSLYDASEAQEQYVDETITIKL